MLLRSLSVLKRHASFPKRAIIEPPTRVTTLPNGLRVASEEGYGQIASVGVWVDTGSRYETAENNGVAHFLEHMAFKGTTSRSVHDIEALMENIGGNLNAYTSREHTAFVAKIFKDDVPKAVDLLADIIQRSVYPAALIQPEKGTILRECDSVAENKFEVLFDLLHQSAYQGTSLGRTILGPRSNIEAMTRETIVDFVRQQYTTPRLVVVGAGAVNHDSLCRLAETAFAELPKEPAADKPAAAMEPAVFTGSQILQHDDDMDVVHVALAVEGPGWAEADTVPLLVMQQLLGSWERTSGAGANVPTELSRQMAAGEYVHNIMAFNVVYKDTSLFGNYFVTTADKIDAAVNSVQNEWMRLCFAVTPEEVARARRSLKAAAMMVDSSAAVAEDIGRQLLCYGRRLPLPEILARIDAVDVATIHRTASRYIYDREPVCAALGGGAEHTPDLNWIRGGNTWWRV